MKAGWRAAISRNAAQCNWLALSAAVMALKANGNVSQSANNNSSLIIWRNEEVAKWLISINGVSNVNGCEKLSSVNRNAVSWLNVSNLFEMSLLKAMAIQRKHGLI